MERSPVVGAPPDDATARTQLEGEELGHSCVVGRSSYPCASSEQLRRREELHDREPRATTERREQIANRWTPPRGGCPKRERESERQMRDAQTRQPATGMEIKHAAATTASRKRRRAGKSSPERLGSGRRTQHA